MQNDSKYPVYVETVKRLQLINSGDEAKVKAVLATLRHGIGTVPGEDPMLWGMLFNALPESMLGRYGKPSKEEWAIHTALTLYAMHQQGKNPKSQNMNCKGVSLGKAAGKLVQAEGGKDDDRERISRRFNQIVLASDIESISYYLRTFIPLLRGYDIGLDYAMLAQDIFCYQTEATRTSVKLVWGQDYYNDEQNGEETEDER